MLKTVKLNKMFLSNPKLNVSFQYLVRKAKGLKGTDLLKKVLCSALRNESIWAAENASSVFSFVWCNSSESFS